VDLAFLQLGSISSRVDGLADAPHGPIGPPVSVHEVMPQRDETTRVPTHLLHGDDVEMSLIAIQGLSYPGMFV